MSVEFIDNRIHVGDVLNDAITAYLYEAAGEIEAETKRNTRTGAVNDGAKLKNSWTHQVDETKKEATVGSPQENAIWEEFGTGEYALEGKGRKGGWWIKVGYGHDEISPEVANAYGWESVQKDSDGKLTFVFTTGKEPSKAMQKAYDKNKSKLKKRLEQIIGGSMT